MVVGLLGNKSPDSNRFTLVTPKPENGVRLQATLGNQNPTGLPVRAVSVGVALKMNNNAIAIIGGVDGPTSVFVAGKLNSVLVSILLIAIGVVMLIVAIIFYFLKKK